jgi:hypothetical protein
MPQIFNSLTCVGVKLRRTFRVVPKCGGESALRTKPQMEKCGGVTPALSTSEQECVYERTPNGPEPVLSLVVVTATFVREVASTDASLDQRELASVNTPMQIEQTRVGDIALMEA